MALTEHLHCPSAMALLPRVLGLELAARGRRLARSVGMGRPVPLPLERFAPPDSALATHAVALLRELSAPYLENHCHRTHAFAVALASHHGRRFDAELLYLACLLHDLGLAPAHHGDGAFELRGARAAHAFCIEHGLSPAKAEVVHEAIALHTSLASANREPEIAYVHLGAGVDVIGYRVEDIARATIDRIVEQWPRHSLKEEIFRDLERESVNSGSPLTQQLKLGLGGRIRAAPFSE